MEPRKKGGFENKAGRVILIYRGTLEICKNGGILSGKTSFECCLIATKHSPRVGEELFLSQGQAKDGLRAIVHPVSWATFTL